MPPPGPLATRRRPASARQCLATDDGRPQEQDSDTPPAPPACAPALASGCSAAFRPSSPIRTASTRCWPHDAVPAGRTAYSTGRAARCVDVGGGAGYFTAAFPTAARTAFWSSRTSASCAAGAPSPARVIGGRLLAAAAATRSVDVVLLLQRAGARAGPGRAHRRDDPGDPARRDGLLSSRLVFAVGRPRDPSPWHYLGGEYAVRRYIRARRKRPRTVRRDMFPLHVGQVLRRCGPGRTSSWSRRGRGTTRAGAGPDLRCRGCANCSRGTCC